MKVLLLSVLLSMISLIEGDEKFLPPRIAHIQAVGCAAYAVKEDQKAYVEVYAKHDSEPGWDYRVIIGERDTAQGAFDDCAKWFKDLKDALTKEQRSNPK